MTSTHFAERYTWTAEIIGYAMRRIPECETWLDVGCGRGIMGAMAYVQRGIKIDGIEIFPQSADAARATYARVHETDALQMLSTMRDKSYDVVTCMEMIEHLPQNLVEQFLGELERVGKFVMLSSVNHFFEQEYDDNAHEQHLSLVTSRQMERRGYKVRGTGPRADRYGALYRVPLRHLASGWLAWRTVGS